MFIFWTFSFIILLPFLNSKRNDLSLNKLKEVYVLLLIMPELQIDAKDVLRSLGKRHRGSDPDSVRELYGSFPGKTTKISFDIKIHNNTRLLIVSGDDGGLSEEDKDNLKRLQRQNTDSKTHSEWGIGCRFAGTHLLIQAIIDDNISGRSFYVTDGSNAFKYTYDDDIGFINNWDELSLDDAIKLFDENPSHIDATYSQTKITKWIVPISSKFETDNVLNDIKKTFSRLIISGEIEIYFEGKKIELDKGLYETAKWDKCKIISANKNKDFSEPGKGKNQARHFYQINDIYYHSDGQIIPKEHISIQKIIGTFEMSYLNPTAENRNAIMDEYNMQQKDYNGLLYAKNGVLLSSQFQLLEGQRTTGTNPDEHVILCINNATPTKTLFQTFENKNNKPQWKPLLKTFTTFYKKHRSSNESNQQNILNNSSTSSHTRNTFTHGGQTTNIQEYTDTEQDDQDEQDDKQEEVSPDNYRKRDFNLQQRTELDRELSRYLKEEYNIDEKRCLSCWRILHHGNTHTGHIIAHSNGGNAERNNGTIICRSCNNNDTRNIIGGDKSMMIEEWGRGSENYRRVWNYMMKYNKIVVEQYPH